MKKINYIVLVCLSFVAMQCTKPDTNPLPPAAIQWATPYINATIDSTTINLAPSTQYTASEANQMKTR